MKEKVEVTDLSQKLKIICHLSMLSKSLSLQQQRNMTRKNNVWSVYLGEKRDGSVLAFWANIGQQDFVKCHFLFPTSASLTTIMS